jgi:hypothetical protein
MFTLENAAHESLSERVEEVKSFFFIRRSDPIFKPMKFRDELLGNFCFRMRRDPFSSVSERLFPYNVCCTISFQAIPRQKIDVSAC